MDFERKFLGFLTKDAQQGCQNSKHRNHYLEDFQENPYFQEKGLYVEFMAATRQTALTLMEEFRKSAQNDSATSDNEFLLATCSGL